jgi:hypothetical protein
VGALKEVYMLAREIQPARSRGSTTYIEAISAILAYTRENPRETPTNPHIRPAVPPSVKPADNNL